MQSYNWKTNLILRCDLLRLIDLYTLIAKTMLTILSSLEQTTYIYITLNCKTRVLKVHLSHLKLNFFLIKNKK